MSDAYCTLGREPRSVAASYRCRITEGIVFHGTASALISDLSVTQFLDDRL